MATTTLKIEGMTCGHCVQAVTQALKGTHVSAMRRWTTQAGRAPGGV